MPARNTIRYDQSNSYYHVYMRGASKAAIFFEDTDKEYFLYLIKRHLSVDPVIAKSGYVYPHYRGEIELLTYCLMDNHFHLLIYQGQQGELSKFMKSIIVAYTAYFNSRYDRSGPIFESRFKASLVNRDAYLMHISRYIHLNPRSWKRYLYSSFGFIKYNKEPEWLQSRRVLEQHASRKEYVKFVADYEENKKMLDEIKHELADK